MGPAGRRGLAALALVAAGGCPPVGPREVTGGKRQAEAKKSALDLLREPGAPRIVAAERSGQGSRLVLIDETGATIRALTDEPVDGSIDITPAWSPDGEWILFASSRGRSSQGEMSLWIVPVFAEGGARRLTDAPTVDMTPAWGADGRIAWASTRGGAGFDIWIADFSNEGGRPRLERPRRVIGHEDEDTMPAAWWNLLVWVRHHAGAASLVSWHEQLDQETVIAPDLLWPAFSSDSKLLAAVFRTQRGDADLLITTTAGKARGAPLREIDGPLGDESAPRFSVDNRFLFAASIARMADGSPLWSSIVFVDLGEDQPKLRVLYDKDPKPRLGVDLAPVALDADALLQAPEYREGLKRVLGALGFEPK